MSFSNNSSRSTLKDQTYGVNLTLIGELDTPKKYLAGNDLQTLLRVPPTQTSTAVLGSGCKVPI